MNETTLRGQESGGINDRSLSDFTLFVSFGRPVNCRLRNAVATAGLITTGGTTGIFATTAGFARIFVTTSWFAAAVAAALLAATAEDSVEQGDAAA